MLEQIIQAVQGQAANYFRQHPDIPNEHAEGAAKAAGAAIMAALQNQVMSGNVSGLQNMLSGKGIDANTMGQIMQQASGLLGGYLNQQGVQGSAALSASQGLMPQLIQLVLGKFMSKAPGDSGFDVGSLINLILGGGQQQQNNNSLLGNILGSVLNSQQGSSILGSILSSVLGGGTNTQEQQQQQRQQQSSAVDLLGGLLGGLFGR